MTEEAKETRRQYYADYRRRNRDRIREAATKWRAANREKAKCYADNYWNKKAAEQGAEREEE